MENGQKTATVLKLLPQATAKLKEIASQEPALRGVGMHLVEALVVAMNSAVAETEQVLARMPPREIEALESRLTLLHAVEDLEIAVGQKAAGGLLKEIIDLIKGVIEKLKNLLPFPPKWKTIINLICTLINALF